MLVLQTHVGFLILLWFVVRSTELALTHYRGGSWGWAIAYGILAFLLIIAALVSLGFHE